MSAQQSVPEIAFTSAADLLKLPDGMHLGEAAGVATNSKGDIYVYTRTGNPYLTLGTSRAVSHGGSRLFQFDRTGKFVREIGQGSYGMLQAQQVRDRSAGQRVARRSDVHAGDEVRSERPRADAPEPQARGDARAGAAAHAAAGRRAGRPDGATARGRRRTWSRRAGQDRAGRAAAACRARASPARASCVRPTSRGTRPATSTSPTATATRASRSTSRTASTSSRGAAADPPPGQFNIVHGIAIDGQGNVYVADEGNKRIQVFDTEGTFKKAFENVGSPTAICLTSGAKPFLYVAHTGDPDGMEDAAIYKLDLDGNVVGKFGRAGKELKQFGLVNSIDCRNENELLIGELSNWRVQKLTLGK